MPPRRVPRCAARRFASRWAATATLWLTPALALADHGVPAPTRSGGLGWMSWLLVAGAVAAVGLAAWAFFAPDRPKDRGATTAGERPEPESPRR